MATSSKGYALTGVLAGGRRRSNNPLVKQAPNNAGPVVVSDTLFSTPVSGAYTLTCQGGAYNLTGASATLSYVPLKPILISSTAITLGTSATPGAQSITVPADAQAVIVTATTYTSGGLTLSLSSDFAGTFTVTTAGNGSDKCHTAYAVVSSTGSKTITPTWSAAVTDGPLFIVSFVKNIDTADFIRQSLAYNANTQGSTTSTTISSSATDLVLALERQTLSSAPTLMSGFTNVTTQVNNSLGGRLQYANSPGASTTTLQSSGTEFPGFSAVSIKYGVTSSGYTLTAQGGAYSVGGGSAILKRSKLLTASGGSYSLTGQSVVITYGAVAVNYTLTAQGGSYSLTGSSANLARNRNLTANSGNYTLTGGSATILRTKRLTASGGSYNITGGTAALLRSKRLVASGGSYSVTGGSAVITKSKLLIASGGVYNVTGANVVITYGAGLAAYTLTAQGGTYNLTGASATISRNKKLTASGGSYTVTGGTATLLRSKYLVASGGSYSITGQSANLYRNRVLTAVGGTYTITGSSVNISWASVGGYPAPQYVLLGVTYGPGNIYVGTMDAVDKSIKFDIITGALVKPINNKVVMSL